MNFSFPLWELLQTGLISWFLWTAHTHRRFLRTGIESCWSEIVALHSHLSDRSISAEDYGILLRETSRLAVELNDLRHHCCLLKERLDNQEETHASPF